MIYVSTETGSKELTPHIRQLGVHAQLQKLPYGDFYMQGNGPNGRINIGVERKTLHDMLDCIDTARYAGRQKGGMKDFYTLSYLAMEGMWKPHEPEGYLMEGFKGGAAWAACRYQSRLSPYEKLHNYLLSVALSGVMVIQSRDIFQTAYNLTAMYHYYQKPWDAHRSMMEVQHLPLAEVGGRPSLCRKWAAQIEGIGVARSETIESVFNTPYKLATASTEEWAAISGLSVRTAMRIYRNIRGED